MRKVYSMQSILKLIPGNCWYVHLFDTILAYNVQAQEPI